ncbi:MAG: hypothetical protein R6V77_01990 [Candidatus Cloacimonadaceae bacterium]
MRHDVDSWPVNAMQMAKIESERGIRSTYYFRMSPLSYNEKIIKRIAALGHEIGYHYEDLTTLNGNYDKAIKTFEYNLAKIRQYYPVKTIAMHGKPLSQWDNLDLWSKYNYKDFGIIGEPYLSINFNEVLYLTDTGNCWDGEKYSIRDSVKSKYKFNIHTTNDLIENLKNGLLPEQIMLNIHPARWNDNLLKWMVRYYMLTVPKYTAKKWVKQWRKRQS